MHNYAAFISYSRSSDAPIAEELQTTIQNLGKPWYKRRSARIFRDDTSLTATPQLWETIVAAMSDSANFVLLASPEAAASEWVQKEVDWWLTNKGSDSLLIVLTGGELHWNNEVDDFDWNEVMPLPRIASGRFSAEPLWIDLREFRNTNRVNQTNKDFVQRASKIAGKVRNISPEDLWSEEVRQQKRNFRMASGAVILLSVFAIAAAVLGVFFYQEWQRSLASGARLLAEKSMRATVNGDAVTGALLALEGMPDQRASLLTPTRWQPLVPETLFALDKAWRTAGLPITDQLNTAMSGVEPHEHTIWFMTLHPDGHRFLTGSNDGKARLSDKRKANQEVIFIGHCQPEIDYGREGCGVMGADISPKGTAIATIGSGDFVARLWNTAGELLKNLDGHTDNLTSIAFSPNGKHIFTTSGDKTARIWDASTGKMQEVLQGHTEYVDTARFSPDSEYLVTVSRDMTAIIWEVKSGARVHTLAGHTDYVMNVNFSPDGSQILTASWDGTARLWDAKTGEPGLVIRGHLKGLGNAKFSPDGKHILTIPETALPMLIWNIEGGLVSSLEGHTGLIHSAVFNETGDRVLSASADGTARLFELNSGQTLAILRGHSQDVVKAIFDGLERHIITASWDGSTRIWSGEGRLIANIVKYPRSNSEHYLSPNNEMWSNTGYNADGRKFVPHSAPHSGGVWNVQLGEITKLASGYNAAIVDAEFSPDGSLLLTAYKDGSARLWNKTTGKLVKLLSGHSKALTSGRFHLDGRRIVTLSRDKTARLWDETGKAISELFGHTGIITSVSFSSDGKRVLTTSKDRTARLWEAENGNLVAILTKETGWVHTAEFNKDGQVIITKGFGGKETSLWDGVNGQFLFVLTPSVSPSDRAIFSFDGQRILTISSDHIARLLNKRGGELMVFPKSIDTANFSPTNRLLMTFKQFENTVQLWDTEAGELKFTLESNSGGIFSAMFSSNGTRLLTRNIGSTMNLWNTRTGELINVLKGDAYDMAIESFGDKILTRSESGYRLKLWNAVNGKIVRTFRGEKSETISNSWFNNLETKILSSTRNGKLIVWDIATGVKQSEFKAHNGGITHAEFTLHGDKILTESYDRKAKLWEFIPNAQSIVERMKHEIPHCLSQLQRQSLSLSSTPPQWCHSEQKLEK